MLAPAHLLKVVLLHLHSTVDLGQIAIGDCVRWLVADTNLKTSRAPINKLNSAFGLEISNCGVDILRNNITTVQHAGGHVLSVAGVALNHLIVGFEAGHGDLLNGVGLMRCLGSRDDGGVGNEREMNAWVWDQVGLKLVKINVQRTIKAE